MRKTVVEDVIQVDVGAKIVTNSVQGIKEILTPFLAS